MYKVPWPVDQRVGVKVVTICHLNWHLGNLTILHLPSTLYVREMVTYLPFILVPQCQASMQLLIYSPSKKMHFLFKCLYKSKPFEGSYFSKLVFNAFSFKKSFLVVILVRDSLFIIWTWKPLYLFAKNHCLTSIYIRCLHFPISMCSLRKRDLSSLSL